MAYSNSGDIQSLIKWATFTNSSKITITELGNFINDADVFIDSKLERIYSTPITHMDDIEILKFISARLAACEVAQVLVLQASGQIPPVVKQWYDSAMDRLGRIIDYTINLPNSSRAQTTKGLYSYTADNNNDCEPRWTMIGDEW